MNKGYIHSTEAGGFVDGPGTRFVVFFAGCPLRCQYCHNPDSWELKSGKLTDSVEIISQISATANFLKRSGGGVTFSGGEPLGQAGFLLTLLKACKDMGLHTAFDTSGYLGQKATREILDHTDLVLLDIKSFNHRIYRDLTGVDIQPTLRFAWKLSRLKKPVWIRFVLVPGLTDGLGNIKELANFAGSLSNVELVEILPFHQMGRYKWKVLGIPYKLENTAPPSPEQMERARRIFMDAGLRLH